jgi:hypothetical protein
VGGGVGVDGGAGGCVRVCGGLCVFVCVCMMHRVGMYTCKCYRSAAMRCANVGPVHSMLVSCGEATKLEVLRKYSRGREGGREAYELQKCLAFLEYLVFTLVGFAGQDR